MEAGGGGRGGQNTVNTSLISSSISTSGVNNTNGYVVITLLNKN